MRHAAAAVDELRIDPGDSLTRTPVTAGRCAGLAEPPRVESRRRRRRVTPSTEGETSMNSVDTSTATPTASPPVGPGEMRLEVVVLGVSEGDRAKRFYEGLGWRLDADLVVDDGYRVVQLTPPGSGCSIIFGTGLTAAAPRSFEGPQLSGCATDAARARPGERGGGCGRVGAGNQRRRAVPRRDGHLPSRRGRRPRGRGGAGARGLRLVR